jgi:xylose isomerase
MNTFELGREHKFAFGLPAWEPWEFVYRLGDVGAWGVGVTDDDLVPIDASPADRDDIIDKFTKALDSTGMVVSMATTNVSDHAVFSNGAFTSTDRDVRRFAIQKTMRAIDLGAELGAQILRLPGRHEAVESVAAKPPLDALERYREAVDFLSGYVTEQGYPTRFALESKPDEWTSDSFLPTTGHALAFLETLSHREIVGLGWVVGPGAHHGVAHAVAADKVIHVGLGARLAGHHTKCFGTASAHDTFFLVKLLEDSGYGGPLEFAIGPHHVDDPDEVGEYAVGCMRTYNAFAAKAKRYADDPAIRDALAESGALELAEPTIGPYSAEAGRTLSIEHFDPEALADRRYRTQRLDQLVVEVVLGLR